MIAIIALVGMVAVAASQDIDDVSHQLDQLGADLDQVESVLKQPWVWREVLEDIRDRVDRVTEESERHKKWAEDQAKKREELLATLGPVPKNESSDPPEVAKRRHELAAGKTALEGSAKRARLLIAQANDLRGRIGESLARLTTRALFQRTAPLTDPARWATAARELDDALETALSRAGYATAAPGSPQHGVAALLVFIGLAVLFGLQVGALRLITRSPGGTSHGGSVQFGPVMRRVLVESGGPVLGALGVLLVLRGLDIISAVEMWLIATAFGPVTGVMAGAAILTGFSTLASRGSPAEPVPEYRLIRLWIVLAGMGGLSYFLSEASQALIAVPELFRVTQFLVRIVVATTAVLLLKKGLFAHVQNVTFAAVRGQRSRRRAQRRALLLGLLLAGAAMVLVANPPLLAAGYWTLSDWLFFGVSGSIGLIGSALLLSRTAHQLGPRLLRRWLRPMLVRGLGLRFPATRLHNVEFWMNAAATLCIWAAAGIAGLHLWSVAPLALASGVRAAGEGVTIGGLHLSVRDVALAFAVFGTLILLTRLTRRTLQTKVFPRTRLDPGARAALSTGISYGGVAIATLSALTTLGVSLSHLVLVAGALSVGIGFGLQAIVNNFVSGVIMLIERPIKVGDWVVVGAHEGIVKRISVRATEIQTFQRASVLVPNSELITGTLTNWTFKDLTGRVDVKVTIAQESDVARVRALLLGCARDHPEILDYPAPRAMLRGFGEYGLECELWAFIRIREVTDKVRVESELREAVLAAFRQHDVSIPYPYHKIHVVASNRTRAVLLAKGQRSEAQGPIRKSRALRRREDAGARS
ncbi:MAG: mechanosensitive ion channel [Proteobacteria bacterium]|nr:mechanosensitive ion channel [Pseudomonadota bacterium]